MSQISLLKAQGISLALGQVTGQTPQVVQEGEKYKIIWSKDQIPAVQKYIEDFMKKQPGEIDIQFMPVIAPVVLKKVLPYAVAYTIGVIVLSKMF